MSELIRLVPANEDDYPNHPAVELHLVGGSYHVYTISMAGETEVKVECHNLITSLAYMTYVLTHIPEIEYVVET